MSQVSALIEKFIIYNIFNVEFFCKKKKKKKKKKQGSLRFGKVDVTEAQFTIITIHMISAIFGPGIWMMEVVFIFITLFKRKQTQRKIIILDGPDRFLIIIIIYKKQ